MFKKSIFLKYTNIVNMSIFWSIFLFIYYIKSVLRYDISGKKPLIFFVHIYDFNMLMHHKLYVKLNDCGLLQKVDGIDGHYLWFRVL